MSSNRFANWQQALTLYSRPRIIAMLFLGFSAGLPFLLVFSTLSALLADQGVTLAAIGFFGWVGMTYSIKFFWAPVIDRLGIYGLTRWLGLRRAWMLVAQMGMALGLLLIAHLDAGEQLTLLALAAFLVAFSSATQDVAIDAYRIEAMEDNYQAAMAATYQFGYRIALLVAGAGALYLADFYSWQWAYTVMAMLCGVGMVTVLLIAEPDHRDRQASFEQEKILLDRWQTGQPSSRWQRVKVWLLVAVYAPFVDFFRRNGWFAVVILLFIATFRLSDITMGIMANPFYLDLGFSKSEIASVAKVFGVFMTMLGAMSCGVLVVRRGIYFGLLLGACMVASTNLLFVLLAWLGHDMLGLTLVIAADNLSGGIAGTAFIAYLSSLTNRAYTATQYALFSSLMTLPGKFISGFSGIVVGDLGYSGFFTLAALLGMPAILLVLVLARYQPQRTPKTNESTLGGML